MSLGYRLAFVAAACLAVLWPATVNGDPRDRDEEVYRIDDLREGEVFLAGRFIVGGAWLGDGYASDVSNAARFSAVAAELDYTLRSRWALSAYGVVGRLASPALYDGVPCPWADEDTQTCIVDMNRNAWWSSLSGGVTKTFGAAAPWTITLRGYGGILLRRYAEASVTERSVSGDTMTMHGQVLGKMGREAWHLSPLVTANAGMGYALFPDWVVGVEIELQASGLTGPPFATSALVVSITHNLSLR